MTDCSSAETQPPGAVWVQSRHPGGTGGLFRRARWSEAWASQATRCLSVAAARPATRRADSGGTKLSECGCVPVKPISARSPRP